jgi:hypothetical protein
MLKSISDLKKPIEVVTQPVQKGYDELFSILFNDGLGIYARVKNQAPSFFQKFLHLKH